VILLYLGADQVVGALALLRAQDKGANRLPPGRHFIHNRHIQVSVYGERQRAGIGVAVITSRCGLEPFARRRRAAPRQSVLLVNNGELQRLELHRRFNQRMGADDYLDAAVFQPSADIFFLRFGGIANEQANGLWGRGASPCSSGMVRRREKVR